MVFSGSKVVVTVRLESILILGISVESYSHVFPQRLDVFPEKIDRENDLKLNRTVIIKFLKKFVFCGGH